MNQNAEAIVRKLKGKHETFYKMKDFLKVYPEFVFNESLKGKTDTWHDLEKKVTPHGIKNSLKYKMSDLMPLIEDEHLFLLSVANKIKNILTIEVADRNKQLFLLVLEKLFLEEGIEVTFSTGGGTKPSVKRVILIFEREGGVCAKKRKVEDVAVVPAPLAAAPVVPTAAAAVVPEVKTVFNNACSVPCEETMCQKQQKIIFVDENVNLDIVHLFHAFRGEFPTYSMPHSESQVTIDGEIFAEDDELMVFDHNEFSCYTPGIEI